MENAINNKNDKIIYFLFEKEKNNLKSNESTYFSRAIKKNIKIASKIYLKLENEEKKRN